jgi:hypothetical protein
MGNPVDPAAWLADYMGGTDPLTYAVAEKLVRLSAKSEFERRRIAKRLLREMNQAIRAQSRIA